jgi:hypothetical protein
MLADGRMVIITLDREVVRASLFDAENKYVSTNSLALVLCTPALASSIE